MLTNKQTKILDGWVNDYRNGLLAALHIPKELADRYAQRYRASMEQEVQRLCKH